MLRKQAAASVAWEAARWGRGARVRAGILTDTWGRPGKRARCNVVSLADVQTGYWAAGLGFLSFFFLVFSFSSQLKLFELKHKFEFKP